MPLCVPSDGCWGGFSRAQCRTTWDGVWPSRAGAVWAMRVAAWLVEQIWAAVRARGVLQCP